MDCVGHLPSHHKHHILCGSSHPLRSRLCHTLYLSRLDRFIPSTILGHAGYSPYLFHFNNCGNLLFTPTTRRPYLESSHQSGISSLCDVDYCNFVVSSEYSHRQTRRGSCSNSVTGRLTAHLCGVQKNSRPSQHLASIGNLFLRKFQCDVYTWHLPGM